MYIFLNGKNHTSVNLRHFFLAAPLFCLLHWQAGS